MSLEQEVSESGVSLCSCKRVGGGSGGGRGGGESLLERRSLVERESDWLLGLKRLLRGLVGSLLIGAVVGLRDLGRRKSQELGGSGGGGGGDEGAADAFMEEKHECGLVSNKMLSIAQQHESDFFEFLVVYSN